MERFIGKYVKMILSGNQCVHGYLVDKGRDILVVNNKQNVYYVLLKHVQNLSLDDRDIESENAKGIPPIAVHPFHMENGPISFRKVLLHARGHFMEINITGNATIHGYLTSTLNDYFVFHSPIFKTIFIALRHLKWLMPYQENVTPYELDPELIPHRFVPTSLPRTFKDQCQNLSGKLVVFDMGDQPNKIGKLQSIDDTNMVEIVEANGAKHFLNFEHLQAVYLP